MEYKNIEIASLFIDSMGEGYINEPYVKDVENIQQIQIIELYKYKVKEEVSSIIEKESTSATITNIEVNIYENTNKKNFGDIHSIEISIRDKLEKNDEKIIIENIASRLDIARNKIKINVSD